MWFCRVCHVDTNFQQVHSLAWWFLLLSILLLADFVQYGVWLSQASQKNVAIIFIYLICCFYSFQVQLWQSLAVCFVVPLLQFICFHTSNMILIIEVICGQLAKEYLAFEIFFLVQFGRFRLCWNYRLFCCLDYLLRVFSMCEILLN